MSEKPANTADYREIKYSDKRWSWLSELRKKAQQLMETLRSNHITSFSYGSIARGDVNRASDVDIFVPEPPSSFLIEKSLEDTRIKINARFVVQATPRSSMKAHLEIDDQTSVSFPLMRLRKVEEEFYGFGGKIDLTQIAAGLRVIGVDKRLMLIEPTKAGHVESSIRGKEAQTAKLLKISLETVIDRSRTLMRRDRVGRTGVFMKKELESEETFELLMKRLAEQHPAIRRRLSGEA